MCRAISAAYKVDEVKSIRDKALALEMYFKQAMNTEAERQACEIRLRGERKGGQLLKKLEKAKGAREPGTERGTRSSPSTASTLKQLGISKDQASKWQQLADVPDAEFEAALAAPKKPSTSGILKKNKPKPKKKPMDPKALWLWGRLRDFERDGLLELEPAALLAEMTDAMQADVTRLAGGVSKWLAGFTKRRPK
jgi:hypothetical protein